MAEEKSEAGKYVVTYSQDALKQELPPYAVERQLETDEKGVFVGETIARTWQKEYADKIREWLENDPN